MKIITFLISFLLFIFSPCFAAITVVQHTGLQSSTNVSTFILNNSNGVNGFTATGNGHLLICIISYPTNVSLTGISDGADSFIEFPNAFALNTTAAFEMDVWYVPKSISGATAVTLNFNGPASFIDFEFWEVSGFTKPVPDTVGIVNNGLTSGGLDTGAAVKPRTANEFIVAGDTTDGSLTANPTGGNEFTSGGDILNGDGFVSYISSSTASAQPQWTDSGGTNFVSSTAAFVDSISRVYLRNSKINNSKFGF